MKALDKFMNKLVLPVVGNDKTRKQYYYSRNYVDSILKKYDSSSIYMALFEICNTRNCVPSQTKIHYSNKINFNDSFEKVKALKSSNVRFTEEVNSFSILFSRTRVGNYKAKLVMSFYKGKLFAYNYTFSYLDEDDKDNIINILREKYLGNNTSIDVLTNTIKDPNGNCLLIEDQIDLVIHYVMPEKEIHNHLVRLSEKENKNKQQLVDYQRKELHSRL